MSHTKPRRPGLRPGRQPRSRSGRQEKQIPSATRKTTIRIAGTEQTVRTSQTGTVKQLEAAHGRAVKAAVIALRTAEYGKTFHAELAATKARAATRFPPDPARTRRRHPRPSRIDVPDYLLELAPNEYATAEAAEAMQACERLDEVLPCLAVARATADGSRWVLRHLPSVTAERPEVHLGPIFKSRKRAREVSAGELAHLDWSRPTQQLLDDPVTSATIRIVMWREFIAAAKRNSWAEPELRKAEADLAAATIALTA